MILRAYPVRGTRRKRFLAGAVEHGRPMKQPNPALLLNRGELDAATLKRLIAAARR
jgi:hypothetical protein